MFEKIKAFADHLPESMRAEFMAAIQLECGHVHAMRDREIAAKTRLRNDMQEFRDQLESEKRTSESLRATCQADRMAFARATVTINGQYKAIIAERDATIDRLRDLLSTISLNLEIIPDPRMGGAADCYRLPLDDGETIIQTAHAENKRAAVLRQINGGE